MRAYRSECFHFFTSRANDTDNTDHADHADLITEGEDLR